jgi:predicted nucleic acid-binding protein
MQYLVDTGVWLRFFDRTDSEHANIRTALQRLRSGGHSLTTCTQNIAEFWNVSTRPKTARGGYGKSVDVTERRVEFIERFATVLDDSPAAYRRCRTLLSQHRIQGTTVHDARLVALMNLAGIQNIVTLSMGDFTRCQGISASQPRDIAVNPQP